MPLLTLRVEFPDERLRYYLYEVLAGAIEDTRERIEPDFTWDWDPDTDHVQEPEDYYDYLEEIEG